MSIRPGACVKIPDGRIGRVRDQNNQGQWRVRVRRKTSHTHQFLYFKRNQLKLISCPNGWMSVNGYNNYLRKTLAKMHQREQQAKMHQRKQQAIIN